MLVGNHDTYFKNTNEVNSVTELIGNRYNNVKIYTEAQEVKLILFCPMKGVIFITLREV